MPIKLGPNEIKDRALRFLREWADETRERAEARRPAAFGTLFSTFLELIAGAWRSLRRRSSAEPVAIKPVQALSICSGKTP